MSLSFIVMMMLVGSSVVIAFVLQPSKEDPPVSRHRCHGESLQSIRKSLLSSLNLQVEPQLPAGWLDVVREQWKSSFSSIAPIASDAAVPAVSGYSDGGNSTNLTCCSVASEIFMRDLGWGSWVVHPAGLTIVHCALCDPKGNIVQCPSSSPIVQKAETQVPCCQPTSQKMVPIVYVDEFSTLTISSVQLTSSCGCGHGNKQQPTEE
uniref:TGF-beta family profile domain-containing protein n=1 Tax=Mola mola TaxID=94237 RepID=A0A3Q3W2G2_MOLML